jgi:hypothetical protein
MRLPKRSFVLAALFVTGAAPAGLNACGENGPSCLAEGSECGALVSDKECCAGPFHCIDSRCVTP